MSYENITIAVDTMGGENAPLKNLRGVEIFCSKRSNVRILLFGSESLIKQTLKLNNINISNFEIFNTNNNITNEDTPNNILRNRKDSSIFQGLEFVKKSPVNTGFVSAGNTLISQS